MPLALPLAAPLSVAIVPVAFCDEDPVAPPVAVPLETLGQALAVAKGVPLREAAIERETLAETEEVLDTDGEPVTVRLTTPVRDPISLREPEMLRPVVPVPLTEAEPVTVPRPDAEPLPV